MRPDASITPTLWQWEILTHAPLCRDIDVHSLIFIYSLCCYCFCFDVLDVGVFHKKLYIFLDSKAGYKRLENCAKMFELTQFFNFFYIFFCVFFDFCWLICAALLFFYTKISQLLKFFNWLACHCYFNVMYIFTIEISRIFKYRLRCVYCSILLLVILICAITQFQCTSCVALLSFTTNTFAFISALYKYIYLLSTIRVLFALVFLFFAV